MNRVTGMTLAILVIGITAPLAASDHTGIYAVIEEVTLKDLQEDGATIQIRGIFSLAKGRREYHDPQHGYMFYRLRDDKADVCRKEWADLKRVAGTGQFVAFGRRYGPKGRQAGVAALGRIRGLDEKPAKPDVYPLNFGVRKIRQSLGYSATGKLAYYATPATPAEGAKVDVGRVKLTADKVRADDEKVIYKFEIETKDGKKIASDAIKAGEKMAEWTPDLEIKAGEKYTWRVWTVSGNPNSRNKQGPVATAHFLGKAAE